MQRFVKGTAALCFALLMLSACFALPTEAPPLPPPVFTPPRAREFLLFPVERGDVLRYTTPTAFYTPASEHHITFADGGIPVLEIHVVEGDIVEPGDLIATLGVVGIDEDIQDLFYERARLLRSINQLNQRHELSLAHAESSGIPVDITDFLETREELRLELSIITGQLDQLIIDDEGQIITTPVGGLVTNAMPQATGRLTTRGSRVATITSIGDSALVLRTAEAEHMNFGDRFEVTIGGEIYLMEVVDPDEHGFVKRPEWTVAAFFEFVDERAAIIPGGQARVMVPQGEARNVVYIDPQNLHEAEERTFVFVYEDGLRVLRDVVVGFWGNNTVEIVSGLEEGELLVR